MSQRMQNEVADLDERVKALSVAVEKLEAAVTEVQSLLLAMTRASTPKGKAA